MTENKDDNYGPVEMGRNQMKKAISLPEEFRDGGVIDLHPEHAIGWEYDGVLHYFPGKGPQDHPGWTFMSRAELEAEEEDDDAD
jgi:hypothetical protein